MRLQYFINLLRRDVDSTFDDQFLGAAHDKEIAVLVLVGQIARVQPAVGVEDRRRSLWILVIGAHDGRAAEKNFAWLAGRHVLPIAINDSGFKTPGQTG